MSELVCPDCLCHCPGCAESASLRERLATAEAEGTRWQRQSDDWQTRGWKLGKGLDAALADAAALRERVVDLESQLMSTDASLLLGTRSLAASETESADRLQRLLAAESLALANGEALAGSREALQSCVDSENALRAERDELRGLLEPFVGKECLPCKSKRKNCDRIRVWGDGECPGIAVRAWFRRHPAIPEGTPAAPKERAIEFLSGCPNCGEEPETWNTMMEEPCRGCGRTLVCNLREDEDGVKHWAFDYAFDDEEPAISDGPPPGERGTP